MRKLTKFDNDMSLFETETKKMFRSPNYNYNFDKRTGYFERWGKTVEDDPMFAPFPEIMDIEISSGYCAGGKNRKGCEFCYKNNSIFAKETHHMTLSDFKVILEKMPWLTQIALGITGIEDNPDFFDIMKWSRAMGVIPNFTCNGYDITDEIATKCASLAGAVAVSMYDWDESFNAIKKFTDAGMTQVNIHYMLSDQTYEDAFKLVDAVTSDPRTEKLNAVVFLAYKNKGAGVGHFTTIVDPAQYRKLTEYCESKNLSFGFDSCSAGIYMKSLEGRPEKNHLAQYVESCESFGLFSCYLNSHGEYFPCSFTEGEGEWKEGLSVLECEDFVKDVWENTKLERYRQASLRSINCDGCRLCLTFPEINVS